MTGEWSTNMFEEIGPGFKGFVLRVQLQKLGEVNQAMTPQTLQEPYWRTFIEVTPVAGTTNQIFWGLSSGSSADQDLLAKVKQALESLTGNKAKAGAAPGDPADKSRPSR